MNATTCRDHISSIADPPGSASCTCQTPLPCSAQTFATRTGNLPRYPCRRTSRSALNVAAFQSREYRSLAVLFHLYAKPEITFPARHGRTSAPGPVTETSSTRPPYALRFSRNFRYSSAARSGPQLGHDLFRQRCPRQRTRSPAVVLSEWGSTRRTSEVSMQSHAQTLGPPPDGAPFFSLDSEKPP